MRDAKHWFLLLPLIFVLCCAGAVAQANSELTGIVTDSTGAVVPGASITLTNQANGFISNTVSDSAGLFDFNGLNPAFYTLKATARGFKTFVKTNIVVNVSGTFHVAVPLAVGAADQTVTVTADALTIQTDSNVVSSLITTQQLSQIATENHNFVALAALGMGVSSELPASNTPSSVAASFAISINGLRESHNIWLIDGGESDDRGGAGGMAIMPSMEGISQFTTMSSNYPPDYGISSGATMSLSLKSGTKTFHGELWEFNRNTDYNANTWNNKQSTPFGQRPPTHYNLYGFNIGGPVMIPHVYNTGRNKTFFFWNEEWRKLTSPTSSDNPTLDPADIPTAGTDLVYVAPKFKPTNQLVVPKVSTSSQYYLTKLAPLGLVPGQPFPNNTIPHSLFDPNAVLYLNAGILPKPTTGNDYSSATIGLPIDIRDDIVRIDHNFNDKWRILGHWIHDSVTQDYGQPELGWCGCNYNTLTSNLSNPANSAAIKLSGTINPSLLVEASINYDANEINITPSANTFLPSGWSVAPVVSAYTVGRKIWPGISGFGAPYNTSEDTATEPYHNAALDYEPRIDVSYTRGKHDMKFGFSLNHYTKNQMLYGDAQGDYGFSAFSGDGIMDMLLGIANSYSQAQSAPIRHYVNNTPSIYAMDNWHVTPQLSLQLGVRWDALPHAWERNNLVGNFNPEHYLAGTGDAPMFDAGGNIDAASPDLYTYLGIPSYANGIDLAGQNGVPRGLVTNDYATIQPRLGFSEDIFGNGKTVLRGGIGTFYERMQGNDIYNAAASLPFDPSLNLGSDYFSTPGTRWDTGAAIGPNDLIFAGGMTDMASKYPAPAVAQYSLGVQHQLAPAMIWIVQYVGNLAWHQNIERQINNMVPGGVGSVTETFNGSPVSLDSRCISGNGQNASQTVSGVATGFADNAACAAGFGQAGGFNAFREYPGFAGITQEENTTNGNYNGFQTGVRVQNRWGLSGEVDYTWSHEIDITSGDLDGVSDPWNLKYDKGSGSYDRRQMLSINYVYNMPFFNHSEAVLKAVAGGWSIAGTAIDESGVPAVPGMSLSGGFDPVGLGGGYTNRPNVSAKMTYPKKEHDFFNTGVWSVPTPSWEGGTNLGFGNSRRDTIVGPGEVNFSTALYKTFAVTERVNFQLRFESFNTFNHTEWNAVSTSLGSGNFGQITGAQDPRNLELAGKFNF
ncbi:MAG: carboxypeptidase regulatory-like domain-containing protein [Terracidiphilus sp.]